jgi:predicted metalloprotease with PDZ domain
MPQHHPQAPALHYVVEAAQPHAHLYHVTLTIAQPAPAQQLSLPVWIPGSYLIREFAKNLQNLHARQGGAALAVVQLDKSTWQVNCQHNQALVVRYEVYANDASVRTASLDAHRGFFNGTSLCLRAAECAHQPHALELRPPPSAPDWHAATGLSAVDVDAHGFGHYLAANYDELVDCPVEMGRFWSGEFNACGVPHRLVVTGAPPSFDHDRLLADTQKICETGIRFWHADAQPPHTRYVFMLNVLDDSYGGLEHRNSTALICGRRDLPRLGEAKTGEGYTTLLGLISHEYFHTWNVKRLRPVEFAQYDYSRENYTHLLWFFEGFTSYYDDLLLRRAGLLDDASYLKLLSKTINQVLQAPGRMLQSLAQSSFDAWVKYYRQDENTPNATISYYTKGALLALCLDLTLRHEGHTTLDEVMRALWHRCAAGPMAEADLHAVLASLGQRDFSPELAQWVHGTADLPLQALLEQRGVAAQQEAAPPAQRLGLRVSETGGVHIKTVLRGSAAERAGFAAGDEWLGVETPTGGSWRLHKLEDLALYVAPAAPPSTVQALVARDKRLLRLPLDLSDTTTVWRLTLRDAALAAPWLNAGQA